MKWVIETEMAHDQTSGKIHGHRQRKCDEWVKENIKDINIRALINEYRQHSIVLYTGAGVSTCPSVKTYKKQFGLPTWIPLLQKVSGHPETLNLPEDPWLAADEAVRICGGREDFNRKLIQTIQAPDNYRGYGQLNGTFVRNALTLKAAAAFCGRITGRKINPQEHEQGFVHFMTSANLRIHAVLTANYDCFLECAASNLYRKSPLKPVTALGSLAGSSDRIPVFHIHGYVPHPIHQKKEREQTIDKLIITREDYENHWKTDDVFGTTMGPQIHYLRYFTVLFIGFSFTDEYVCKLLRRVHKDYLSHAGRTHFALLSSNAVRKHKESFFREMGIAPIIFDSYEQIPSILGQVYTAGLVTDMISAGEQSLKRIKFPGLLIKKYTPVPQSFSYPIDDIWKMMLSLSNESVNIKKLDETL